MFDLRDEPMGDYRGSQLANPPRGEKGDFRKVSFTLPPRAYKLLIEESARRRIAGQSNQLLSALLREAVVDYLSRIETLEE